MMGEFYLPTLRTRKYIFNNSWLKHWCKELYMLKFRQYSNSNYCREGIVMKCSICGINRLLFSERQNLRDLTPHVDLEPGRPGS